LITMLDHFVICQYIWNPTLTGFAGVGNLETSEQICKKANEVRLDIAVALARSTKVINVLLGFSSFVHRRFVVLILVITKAINIATMLTLAVSTML